ncbi:MAG: AAA family ATPase, partial [Candidatus Micrarchaeota archaeon]|nr:AAA family ATPase [Candidatus Micrarchaeota archaeon]
MASASLHGQKLKAVVATMRQDSSLWPALLVAAGALFLLNLFTFYPLWVTLLLAIACGAVAYWKPPAGTMLSVLLAFPAIAYQSPLFAWLYLLIIALCLFEVFSNWAIISFLQIIICAPFSPLPLGYLGGFVQFGLAIGALYSGSKRSIYISLPAVFFILLLTTLWLTPNSAFMVTRDLSSTYGPAADALSRSRLPEAAVLDLPSQAAAGLLGMLSPAVVFSVSSALEKVVSNTLTLLISDAAVLQLLAWAVVLFLVGLIPGRYSGSHKQVLAGLALLLIPASHYLITIAYGIEFPAEILLYTAVSIVALFALEHYKIDLSRERLLSRREKTKTFGKFGVEDLGDSAGPASLDEVGGYDDVKMELREAIVTPLSNKELALTYGIKPASGLLLFGPPGTGKTMLMRALSKELSMGFYYIKCSELLSEWYGESEKNVTELFNTARKSAPCILFFDEIDALAKRRDQYSADDVAPRVMATLLAEMDGFKSNAAKPVIVIGATNIPDRLDPAIMRPGRLDKIIYMHLPDAPAREAILRVHTKKMPLSPDVDFAKLAKMTERFSGADLANLATEATRLAAREAASQDAIVPLAQKHFLSVLKSIRPSTSLESLSTYAQFRMDFERRTSASAPEPESKPVSWDDVVGLDDVRAVLQEAIELPLMHEELMAEYKVKPAKGLLLFGPPGCGKTLIVRAAASQLKATFLSISGADLVKNGPERAAQTLKQAFNRAREQPPALVFIDEIESLTPSRSSYSSPILTQLLQELDGTAELKNVMVIGATNKPSQVDSAMLRPGRFDKIIYIPPPDAPARAALFSHQLLSLAPDLDAGALAAQSAGFSGADIASVCQEAKMKMVRSRIAGDR